MHPLRSYTHAQSVGRSGPRGPHAGLGSLAVALVVSVGCASPPPMPVNPGESTGARFAEPARKGADAGPRGDIDPLDLLGDLSRLEKVTAEPFVSQGHFAGRWRAEILVSPRFASEYRALSMHTAVPTGIVIVKRHFTLSSSPIAPAPGPVFGMVKREANFFRGGGDWEYVSVDSDGKIEARGRLGLCARCHAEAPFGSLFGLPRSLPRGAGNADGPG